MDIRVLTYFMTVAREKTISKAAEVLHLSQPTLSKQLKELEEELGVQLFIRGNREISLTEDGIYLRNRGQEILSLVDTTTSNLAKTLNELMVTYPDITVEMYSGNADDVKDKLDKGLLDFGLVIDPMEKQKYEYLALPVSDRWGVLVNDFYPLAKKERVFPSDLKDHSLLVSSQTMVNHQLSEWLGGNLSQFKIAGSYNLLYNASLFVKEGTTVAFCLDGIIPTENNGLVFVPLAPELTAKISIIWKKKQVFSNAARRFLDALPTS